MVKQFFKDDYASLELDNDVPCVKLTLRGVPRFSEHYQQIQLKRLDLMHSELKNFETLHMLTDSREAGPVLTDDVNFFKDQILPEMERAGVKYLAIVMPAGKFTRLTVNEMTADADTIKVGTFEQMRDARAWLKSKSVVMI